MRCFVRCSVLVCLVVWASASNAETVGERLERELAAKAAASAKRGDPNFKVMKSAIDAIKDLPKGAPKVGDILPHFALPDANGKVVDMNTLVKKKSLIVTFYRGGWCPYCNLQLRAFQKALGAIKSRGGELVAISPETPDNTLSTRQKNNLDFIVLSDADNAYSRKLGLVFTLPGDLVKIYQKFGIDLPKSNGLNKWELPLAATFVVNSSRKIVYAFVDADYKKRANIDDVLAALSLK